MEKKCVAGRITAISRILVVCLAVIVASCEELTDSLSPRDNIVDTWKCQETDASNGTDSFFVEIVADNSSLSGIKIENFNHLGITISANVSGPTITIPAQDVSGFSVSGSGTISSNYEKITMKYSVDDGGIGGKENYNAVLTKP